MKIQEKLRIIQQTSGYTQEILAKEIGVSFVTFNSWINGRSVPRKRNIKNIDEMYAKYTGTSVIPDTELDAKKGILQKKSQQFKNIVQHIQKRTDIYNQFVLSLTYNSNGIEGSTFTEGDTEGVLFRNASIPNKSLNEHLEAKNHQTALTFLFQYMTTDALIDESFIFKLHSILMNSIRDDAGFYRTHAVRIVGAGVSTANYLSIEKKMDVLIKDINTYDEDIIGQVSGIHSRFEQIHPFSDGNGRIGRLLMHAMLLKRNLPPAVIQQKKKNVYYTYLRKSQTEGDVSLLESFVCDAIATGFDIIDGK